MVAGEYLHKIQGYHFIRSMDMMPVGRTVQCPHKIITASTEPSITIMYVGKYFYSNTKYTLQSPFFSVLSPQFNRYTFNHKT